MNISEFQQRIAGNQKPIVIDFWAPWCAPCQITKPILHKLAREYAGKVDLLVINADSAQDVLRTLKIFSIPTVVTYRAGNEVARIVGARSEANYRAMFEALATGRQVTVLLTAFDRLLRLGSGMLLGLYGISSGNWLIAGIGGLLAFMGIYDRCPIWRAITGYFKGKEGSV